jgi:transcriptional regulator with XRE-family HTH domain
MASMDEADSRVFGTLLKYFRNRAGLTQEDLAHRAGKQSRASIVAWENSLYLPREREIVLVLSRVLRLTENETDRLLLAAHFPPEFQTRPPVPEQTRATEREGTGHPRKVDLALPPHIPDEPYYALPGREQNLEELLTAFRDQQAPPAVVIDGLGGIGKTAFAVELARRALSRQLFEKVVGDSAKQEHFIGGEIVRVSEATLDFNNFLDAIARQLDHWEIPSLPTEEKQSKLAQLLRQHRYLILVDNLETVGNAQKLVAELRGFLSSSRTLITSREKVPHDFVRSLSLHELELKDALFFLRKDLEQRGRDHPLAQAPREKFTEIWEATGGAPLAMKLVVAQTRSLAVDLVLRHLKQAGNKLYSFIFRQSWQLLSLPAQLVLIYIGKTVPATVSWEELAGVNEITNDEEELLTALHQLVHYSLLDVYPLPGQVRYGIHPLTRQFVRTDLPLMWQKQEQAPS